MGVYKTKTEDRRPKTEDRRPKTGGTLLDDCVQLSGEDT